MLFLCLSAVNRAAAQEQDLSMMDSVEIGLVTCSPHDEVYSLYGHTAIRYLDLRTGADSVYNYGIFNFNKPYFILRFIFGKTDYELGRAPTYPFCAYYAQWGCQVTEQVLNLTREEKARIVNALRHNYLSENRVYRYNFFYDNCSTRPRNIIEDHIDGHIVYAPREGYEPSYREMIHEHTRRNPWAAFGNDLLLGVNADKKTTLREQEFLPENLRYDFDHARINRNGQETDLVKERRQLVYPGVQVTEQGIPLKPIHLAIILLCITLIIMGYEYMKKTCLWWYDILLMLLTGLPGIVLTAMIFSEHPTTSLNLQLLVLNPLSLLFLWQVWKKRHSRWFTISRILILAFFAFSFCQDYAEGMKIVALCLLLRTWKFTHTHHDK